MSLDLKETATSMKVSDLAFIITVAPHPSAPPNTIPYMPDYAVPPPSHLTRIPRPLPNLNMANVYPPSHRVTQYCSGFYLSLSTRPISILGTLLKMPLMRNGRLFLEELVEIPTLTLSQCGSLFKARGSLNQMTSQTIYMYVFFSPAITCQTGVAGPAR